MLKYPDRDTRELPREPQGDHRPSYESPEFHGWTPFSRVKEILTPPSAYSLITLFLLKCNMCVLTKFFLLCLQFNDIWKQGPHKTPEVEPKGDRGGYGDILHPK